MSGKWPPGGRQERDGEPPVVELPGGSGCPQWSLGWGGDRKCPWPLQEGEEDSAVFLLLKIIFRRKEVYEK